MPTRKATANPRHWFLDGTEENLVRETLESLEVPEDPERWLRRLAMLRERLVQERRQALHEQRIMRQHAARRHARGDV